MFLMYWQHASRHCLLHFSSNGDGLVIWDFVNEISNDYACLIIFTHNSIVFIFRLTEVYTSSIRVIEAVTQKYCKKKILSAEMISSYRGAILHGILSS